MPILIIPGLFLSLLFACSDAKPSPPMAKFPERVSEIATPHNSVRVATDTQSFAQYLRSLELQPEGHPVHLYNGELKGNQNAHYAVLTLDVGGRDLQQCADAVMRLRAEYLYQQGRYRDISFNFTNGFPASYHRWRNGERIRVEGNKTSWIKSANRDTSYRQFRKYMDIVFSYAGTASLEKELKPIAPNELQPGDVFIRGGHPGHAVIVMDLASDTAGQKYFLLAQSYMPAQEIHILRNPNRPDLSPWYALSDMDAPLVTPEWVFEKGQLRRF